MAYQMHQSSRSVRRKESTQGSRCHHRRFRSYALCVVRRTSSSSRRSCGSFRVRRGRSLCRVSDGYGRRCRGSNWKWTTDVSSDSWQTAQYRGVLGRLLLVVLRLCASEGQVMTSYDYDCAINDLQSTCTLVIFTLVFRWRSLGKTCHLPLISLEPTPIRIATARQ